MRLFTQLHLDEVSVVGEGYSPKNPAAKAVLYKAGKQKEKGEGMAADNAAETLLGKVAEVMKGWSRTTTYKSESTATENVEETAMQQQGNGGVAQGAANAAPVAPVQQAAAPAVDVATVITQAVTAAVEPLRQSVAAMDSRLAAVESKPVGSAAVDKAARSLAQVSSPLGDAGAAFLAQIRQATGVSVLTKATITSGGWTVGLRHKQAEQFIDFEIDQTALLKKVRRVKMDARTQDIDKIGLGGKVLKKGTEGADPSDTVALAANSRITLTAKETVGIVSISDDTISDTIEEGMLVEHLMKMISAAAANELEEAALHGDTAVADTFILDLFDGYYKLGKAGGQVIEGMADTNRFWPGATGAKGTKLLKALPQKYRLDPSKLLFIANSDIYLDFGDELAKVGANEGFLSITGMRELQHRGISYAKVPLLKTNMAFTYSSTNYTDGTFVMCTDPQNLIYGVYKEINIEADRKPRARATDFVFTQRVAVAIENAAALSIYDHAKVAA